MPDPMPAPTPAPSNDLGVDAAQFQATFGMTVEEWKAQAASAGVGADEPTVFWDHGEVDRKTISPGWDDLSPTTGQPTGPMPEYQRITKTVTEAKRDVFSWTDAELETFGTRLVEAGMLPEDYTRDDLERAWGNLVDKSAEWTAAGRDLSPFDMIGIYAGTNAATGESMKPTSRQVVQRQANLADADQARGLLNQMLSEQLGRRATAQEIDDFQTAINDAQRSSPTVTTSTYDTDAQGNQKISSTTEGGVDVGDFTEKYVQDGGKFDAEYGRYQAATTYANALFQAIQSPVPSG